MFNKEKARKYIPLVSGVFLIAMSISSLAGMFGSTSVQPNPSSQQASMEQQIASQKRGYEIVLQREPNNEIALRGLVELAIQANNLTEAIPPLEKLVKLNPNYPEYQTLLTEVKARASQTNPPINDNKSQGK